MSDYVTHLVCVAAYALLIGMKGSSAQTVISNIKNNIPPVFPVLAETGLGVETTQDRKRQEGLDYVQLQQYVQQQLMKSHEMNPAPGAHRDKETVLNKGSWASKWKACCDFFENHTALRRTVGSMSMLKRVWRREMHLKEKTASSHSKCDICKDIDIALHKLWGDNSEWATGERKRLQRLKAEHEGRHLGARSIFDGHGFLACVNPAAVWCICCDAATARNMELPRYNTKQFRLPKCACGHHPKWKMKLTATYCFGYGFLPFLTHDSLMHGPNLVWTTIWLSICKMRKHYGNYPDVLFILLDNTTGVLQLAGRHKASEAGEGVLPDGRPHTHHY